MTLLNFSDLTQLLLPPAPYSYHLLIFPKVKDNNFIPRYLLSDPPPFHDNVVISTDSFFFVWENVWWLMRDTLLHYELVCFQIQYTFKNCDKNFVMSRISSFSELLAPKIKISSSRILTHYHRSRFMYFNIYICKKVLQPLK